MSAPADAQQQTNGADAGGLAAYTEDAARLQRDSSISPNAYQTDVRQSPVRSIGAVPGLPYASQHAYVEEEAHKERMGRRKTQYRCAVSFATFGAASG